MIDKDYFSLRRVSDENKLTNYPDIVAEWHSIKNGKRKPENFTNKSGVKVWWKCSKGHSPWKTAISHRVNGTNCPDCSGLSSKPELIILSELREIFDFEITYRHMVHGKEADIFICDYNTAIEYDGYYFHKDRVNQDKEKNIRFNNNNINLIRLRHDGLPRLSLHDIFVPSDELKKTDIDKLIQLLLKNLNQEDKLKAKLYLSQPNLIGQKTFNLYLSHLPGPIEEKSLQYRFPNIAKEWDFNRNSPLKPTDFTAFSHHIVWWKCAKGHPSWPSIIANRTRRRGGGCPFCSNHYSTRRLADE